MCTVIIYSTSKSRGDRIHCMWNLLWQTIPDYVSLPLCSGSWSFHYWLELLINSSSKWQNRVGSHLPIEAYTISWDCTQRNRLLNSGVVRGLQDTGWDAVALLGRSQLLETKKRWCGDDVMIEFRVIAVVRFQGTLSDQGFVSQQMPSFCSFKGTYTCPENSETSGCWQFDIVCCLDLMGSIL